MKKINNYSYKLWADFYPDTVGWDWKTIRKQHLLAPCIFLTIPITSVDSNCYKLAAYCLYVNVVRLLFLCHLENGGDSSHVAGNVIIYLSTFLHQPSLIVVNSQQSVKQLLELGMKRLHTILANYLSNCLHKSVRKLLLYYCIISVAKL